MDSVNFDFMKVAIINGPNLNMLGKREVVHYGDRNFEDYLEELRSAFPEVNLTYFQSNSEGALVDCIQELSADEALNGVVLNLGAYTHTSIAIADAVQLLKIPVIEVHITNIFSREAFRHHSFISPLAKAVITGLGLDGYTSAVSFLLKTES